MSAIKEAIEQAVLLRNTEIKLSGSKYEMLDYREAVLFQNPESKGLDKAVCFFSVFLALRSKVLISEKHHAEAGHQFTEEEKDFVRTLFLKRLIEKSLVLTLPEF